MGSPVDAGPAQRDPAVAEPLASSSGRAGSAGRGPWTPADSSAADGASAVGRRQAEPAVRGSLRDLGPTVGIALSAPTLDAGPPVLSTAHASRATADDDSPRLAAPATATSGDLSPGGGAGRSALLALLIGHAPNGAVVIPLMLVLDLAVLLLVLGVPFARSRTTRVAAQFGCARLGHRAVALRPG